MTRGKFITFEGGEGSGKSTQARRLAEALQLASINTVLTREPGGTPRAEAIRAILFDRRFSAPSALTEALLFNAARADHLAALVEPNLARGTWVICDRFMDSTRAYQGAAGGLASSDIDQLERLTVGPLRPDLTLILDLDPAIGLARARQRQQQTTPANQEQDPFEARAHAFHEKLRSAYLAIATAEPARCSVIDASRSVDAIHSDIKAAVWQTFNLGLA